MNDFIAILLMSKLLDIDYIEKFGGTVQTIQCTTKNARNEDDIYRIPVAKAFHQFKDDKKDANENRIEILRCGLTKKILEDFVPESKLSGMVYFQDNGISPDTSRRHTGLNFWISKLRLIGWFNQKKFRNQFDNEFRSQAMLEIIGKITTRRPINQGVIKFLHVTVDNVPSTDASIFADYDFNESQNQFITAPYDFFAIDLNIAFGTPKNCLIQFTPEAIIC